MDAHTLTGLLLRRIHPFLQLHLNGLGGPAGRGAVFPLPLAAIIGSRQHCHHHRQQRDDHNWFSAGRPGLGSGQDALCSVLSDIRQHCSTDPMRHINKWHAHLANSHSMSYADSQNHRRHSHSHIGHTVTPSHNHHNYNQSSATSHHHSRSASLCTRQLTLGQLSICDSSSYHGTAHWLLSPGAQWQRRGLHGTSPAMQAAEPAQDEAVQSEHASASDEQVAPKMHLFISQYEKQRTPATSMTWKEASNSPHKMLQPGMSAEARHIFFPNITLQMMRLPDDQVEQIRQHGWVREAAFKTTPNVTKLEIKSYLEAVYGMSVERVSTINYLGRKRSIRPSSPTAANRGNVTAREDDWKKAYVIFKDPPADMPRPDPPSLASAQHRALLETVRDLRTKPKAAADMSRRKKHVYIDTKSCHIINGAPELEAFAKAHGELPRALPEP